MAVFERNYRPYEGELTPQETRFLVLPRYAYRRVFSSRLFTALIVAWFIWPLVLATLLYLPHNVKVLEFFGTTSEQLTSVLRYDAGWFFSWYQAPLIFFMFLITLILGPALVSADLRNNGLALYLARPFSRTEYIVGKVSVLALLLSLVSWVPGLGLFFFQSYLGGLDWLRDNYRVGIAIFLACAVWIAVLCVLSLALSAYLKWRPIAGLALLAIFFLSPLMAAILNATLRTEWASVIDLSAVIRVVWSQLFGIDSGVGIPVWSAWCSLLVFCSFCVWLLYRKVRAYEVVRS